MSNIVRGQRINPQKRTQAKELRSNQTPTEKQLWQAVRSSKVGGYHFRRQQIIDGLIVDFYSHEAALIIEIDGALHDQQQQYDDERSQILKRRWLTVLRFRNEQITRDLPNCLATILSACRLSVQKPRPCCGLALSSTKQ